MVLELGSHMFERPVPDTAVEPAESEAGRDRTAAKIGHSLSQDRA